MQRYGIIIAGQSGQGVDSMGALLGTTLKHLGYHVIAYREYESLIKGGNATYFINFSEQPIHGISTTADAVLVLNKQRCLWHMDKLRPGGLLIHDINDPLLTEEDTQLLLEKNIQMLFLPAIAMAKEHGGNLLMANMAELGLLWRLLGLPTEPILANFNVLFARKPQMVAGNVAVFQTGYEYPITDWNTLNYSLNSKSAPTARIPAPDTAHCHSYFTLTPPGGLAEHLLIGGNEAIGLGAVSAGVRAYFAYPMTPASSLLSYLAKISHLTGMVVRQAEDEISAAALTLGASFAGTRAMVGTSGGGYDLMTEHTSLAGILESPFVCVLAQRPGPATGLPTWTCQSDLLLAIHGGHGEYPKIVLSCSDPEDAYYLTQEAHNLAERYQVPVILLTEKVIAESNFTIPPLEEGRISIQRHILEKAPEHGQRYAITADGISPRWLPGTNNPDYNANSDEHDPYGNVDESSDNAIAMADKRAQKFTTIAANLPDPVRYDNGLPLNEHTKTFIGWGSVKGPILDLLHTLGEQGTPAVYLHLTYLWPFPSEAVTTFLKEFPHTILVENNQHGQLGQLITTHTKQTITQQHLKYDGRPFFLEDLTPYLTPQS